MRVLQSGGGGLSIIFTIFMKRLTGLRVLAFRGGGGTARSVQVLTKKYHLTNHLTSLRSCHDDLNLSMKQIELEINELAGRVINLNSPKQIKTLFGPSLKSTSRKDLLSFIATSADDKSLTRRVKLAQNVLQWRSFNNVLVKNSKRPFSSVTITTTTTTRPSFTQNKGESSSTSDEIPSSESPRTSILADFTYPERVDALFICASSQINAYWKDALLKVDKPSAQALVEQLSINCPMGYDPLATSTQSSTTAGKKGSLLAYVREQKERFPEAIILTRVGDFYEAFGIDAIMLVEHCGLNAMGGKGRAGCPYRNVQATLDGLTSKGFTVAVFEEAMDTDSAPGPAAAGGSKSRLKQRLLAQIVSSASPIYMYDLVMSNTGVSNTPSRPHYGLVSSASGYDLIEISLEERTISVTERLTAESVACRLSAFPPSDPLFYVPSPGEVESSGKNIDSMLPFLPSRMDTSLEGVGASIRTKILSPFLVQTEKPGISHIQRIQKTVLTELLKLCDVTENYEGIASKREEFTELNRSRPTSEVSTESLHVETATQLGLMGDPHIPSLVHNLLPMSAPAPTRRLLRRWLLDPPPPLVADSISSLVYAMKEDPSISLPPLRVPPVGKVLSLIRAGQASAPVFRDLVISLSATVSVLYLYEKPIVNSLLKILEFETGLGSDAISLQNRCEEVMELIKGIVSIEDNNENDVITDYGDVVPFGFFERNEQSWRGRIRPIVVELAYNDVHNKSLALVEAVASDFWGGSLEEVKDGKAAESKSPIVQDIFNNIFALRAIPKWGDFDNYFHPKDRNGKLLRTRYTTKLVETALGEYLEACENASRAISTALVDLSNDICNHHLPAVVQSSHTNLILSTAFHHVQSANKRGWNIGTVYAKNGETSESSMTVGKFIDVFPYWMDKSQSVANSFDLEGLFLLTAPNMSGKSTLMRSTAAAALLMTCGLCAPLSGDSTLKRFDTLFVRGASTDVPAEGKSAFGAEVGDIASMLRTCGNNSLVFVDELGRGTSPTDGTSLAAAVLEEMSLKGMSGIFATHLHEIFDLPLNDDALKRIKRKRMEIQETEKGEYTWTFKLKNGSCTESLALTTAAKFGLPPNVLERASELTFFIKNRDLSKNYLNGLVPLRPGDDVDINRFSQERNGGCNSYLSIQETMKMTAGELSKGNVVCIPPGWHSPASMEGKSCVYVIERSDKSLYIGETDSLSQRLKQHRSKGDLWKSGTTFAVGIEGGKTNAKNVESLLIQIFAKMGIHDLVSISDGTSISTRNN